MTSLSTPLSPPPDGGVNTETTMANEHPYSVLEVLSTERLDALRAAYSRDAMNAGARGSLEGRFAGATPMAEALLGRYFETTDNLACDNRERVILGMLAMRRADAELAIHVYWGLMEGLSVAEIADIFVLTGGYMGISQYNNAVGVMHTVLCTLADLKEQDLSSLTCVKAISAAIQVS